MVSAQLFAGTSWPPAWHAGDGVHRSGHAGAVKRSFITSIGTDRYKNLMTYTNHSPTFVGQINFIDHELTGPTFSHVLTAVDDGIRRSSSASSALYAATEIVMAEYEKPSGAVNYNNGTYSITPGSIAAKSLPTRYADTVAIYDAF
jgi:hypothetical protein